jgi:hypothetical protein
MAITQERKIDTTSLTQTQRHRDVFNVSVTSAISLKTEYFFFFI